MSFYKSNKFQYKFSSILFICLLSFSSFAQINKANFRIDTLKAFYTSGTPPFQIKGSIHLAFKIPAGKEATLNIKKGPTGSYSSVGIFGATTTSQTQHLTVTIPDLYVRDEYYCFYLSLKNGAATVVTSELCSIPFTKEAKISLANKIIFQVGSYQPGTGNPNDTFRPYITGKCLSQFGCTDDIDDFATNTKLKPPYYAQKEFNSIVKCGELKSYQAFIDIDGMITISDTIQNFGYTKQIPSKLIEEWAYATVLNDKVKLDWKNDETINDTLTIEKKFIIERKDGINGTYITLPDSPELNRQNSTKFTWEYIDNTSTPSKIQHFYRLKYEDLCENVSPPINIYPLFLEQTPSFDLIWSKENNNKVIDFELEYLDITTADPRKTQLIQPKGNKYKAETSNFYRIKAKQFRGDGSYIYSNFIPNNENLNVLNPNVFTPDGNGPDETETFKVTCAAAYTFNISIFDRTGLLVYFSDNYAAHRRDGWNGKMIYTDLQMPEGQYVFQVEVTNSNHKSFTKRGNVLLIRN